MLAMTPAFLSTLPNPPRLVRPCFEYISSIKFILKHTGRSFRCYAATNVHVVESFKHQLNEKSYITEVLW